MSDIEDARTRWIQEQPKYKAFAALMKDRIIQSLKHIGIWHAVDARAKEVDSLVKKLIKKPHHTYESLTDKAGARVVVRYLSEIQPIVDSVRTTFDSQEPDNKLGLLGADRVGYRSIHLDDFRFKEKDPAAAHYPPATFKLELQVRTLAQDLWSEMSHDSVYKSDEWVNRLPADVRRRVNLMAGQIEVADREFNRLGEELMKD